MDRRLFFRTTLSASIAASFPVLAACDRKEPDKPQLLASKAETGVAAISLDGAEIELEKAAIRELGDAMTGPVILADNSRYDTARRIWNGMHDKRPALIAQCANTQDVCEAVDFARDNNVLLAVRGGGHSWPGKSVCNDGLVIDLSPMKRVAVDAKNRLAQAQGGALLNHLDTATLAQGLVTTTGVVSHTGCGGYTLGGGFGRLNRKFGLTIDNLVSAEIVTADGQIRRVSADEDADLFWAIRGGGGNFGVATSFEYQLHPFERNILSGMIVWPIEQADAVIDFYADWYAGLSDDCYVGPVMGTFPEIGSVIAMEVVYAGDPSAGEKELAPLRAIGKPLDDGIKMQDYSVMQTQEDATFAHGIRSYAKNGLVKEVTTDLLKAIKDGFIPDGRYSFFTHTAGGAVNQVAEDATAFPHRNAETMVGFVAGWADPADDAEVIANLRQWFGAAEPFIGGYYDNIEFDESAGTAGSYGPAYARLANIKGRYDPGNLFRLNRNINPAA